MKDSGDHKKLSPDQIASIKMGADRIMHIWFNHPISNAKVDYEVALYIKEEKRKLEKKHGMPLGLLVDLNNYHRKDATSIFGITVPSFKVRQMHSEMHKEAILERVAFYKKGAPQAAAAAVRMAAMYHSKDVRLFGNQKEAMKWLKEGAKELLKTEKEKRNS